MSSRKSAKRDPAEHARFLGRMIRAACSRIQDPADLPALAEIHALFDVEIKRAVQRLNANGYSWSEIASGAGVSKQLAHHRWAGRQPTASTGKGGAS